MKKTALCIMALGLSLTFQPLQSIAAAKVAPSSMTTSTDPEAVKVLVLRLNEIKNMDKTNLTASEKKGLRKELKSLKREIRSSNRGIYLSIGAVIIIILLLVILL